MRYVYQELAIAGPVSFKFEIKSAVFSLKEVEV